MTQTDLTLLLEVSTPSKNNVAEGSGTLNKDAIVMSYYINDGNQIDTVSANYTRDYN